MSQNAKVFYLKKNQIFSELSDKQIREMAELMHDKSLKVCEMVFSSDDLDKVFFVKKGTVDIYLITQEGKKLVVDRLTSGAFFGSVGPGLPDEYYIEASEDSYICVVGKDKLFTMLEKYPVFARRLVEQLFAQMLGLQKKISVMTLGTIKQKLLYLFTNLVKQDHIQDKRRHLLTRSFTHEELAEMIGSSRETVTKMLSILEKEKIIRKVGRKIEIDLHQLETHM